MPILAPIRRVVSTALLSVLLLATGGATAEAHVGILIGTDSFLGERWRLSSPSGVAVAADGSVFVADRDNHRILKIRRDGQRVELFAGAGEGDRIDPNSAANTELEEPTAIALSPDGASVFIVDTYNHRILKVSSDGSSVELFAGADWDNQIDPTSAANSSDGSAVELFAGTGDRDRIDPTSAANTELNEPYAIALSPDGASVFIADAGNYRILKVSSDGSAVQLFAGGGEDVGGEDDRIDRNSAAYTKLIDPHAIALSPDGASVFIADTRHHRILKANAAGTKVERFAGTGSPGRSLDSDNAMNTNLNWPTGLAISADGSVLIGENFGRTLRIRGDGKKVERLDEQEERTSSQTQHTITWSVGEVVPPVGVAVAPDGTIFLSEARKNRILKLSADGKSEGVFMGAGLDPFNWQTIATEVSEPNEVAHAPDGSIFVSDHASEYHTARLLRISPDGTSVQWFAGTGEEGNYLNPNDARDIDFDRISGVAVRRDGWVLVADMNNHRVLEISPDGGSVRIFAGTGEEGDHIDPYSAQKTHVNRPSGIAIAPDGSVFIAQEESPRILKISADGTDVKWFAGTGEEGDALDEASARNTSFARPRGLLVDQDGSLFVADSFNHRIIKISADGKKVERFAGTGEIGDHIEPENASNTALHLPCSLLLLSDQSLIIGDLSNHRILKVNAQGTRVQRFAGTGEKGTQVHPTNPLETQLSQPHGMALLPDGSILVADMENDRLLLFGAEDEYEDALRGVVENGKDALNHWQRERFHRVLGDLGVLATANPRNPNGRLSAQSTREKRRLALLDNALATLPRDVKEKMIADFVDRDPAQPVRRLRATLALNVLKRHFERKQVDDRVATPGTVGPQPWSRVDGMDLGDADIWTLIAQVRSEDAPDPEEALPEQEYTLAFDWPTDNRSPFTPDKKPNAGKRERQDEGGAENAVGADRSTTKRANADDQKGAESMSDGA